MAYYHPRGLYCRLDVKNQGTLHYYDDANKDFARQSSYTVADMRIGWRFGDWDIFAYVKNLTDEEYITAFKSNSMITLADFGEPGTFGVGVRYQF